MNFDFLIGYGPSLTGNHNRKPLIQTGPGNRKETKNLPKHLQNFIGRYRWPRLIASLGEGRLQDIQPIEPVLCMGPPEQRAFKERLNACQNYLEFGAGGSTLAAVRSGAKRIVTVESDQTWLDKLRKHPEITEALNNNRLIFHRVDIGQVGAWGFPANESAIKRWHLYWSDPFIKFSAPPFDLILVDGRFRVACSLAAAVFSPKNATIMVHDYELRSWYYEVEKFFDILERVETLCILRPRENINIRSLYVSIFMHLFDER